MADGRFNVLPSKPRTLPSIGSCRSLHRSRYQRCMGDRPISVNSTPFLLASKQYARWRSGTCDSNHQPLLRLRGARQRVFSNKCCKRRSWRIHFPKLRATWVRYGASGSIWYRGIQRVFRLQRSRGRFGDTLCRGVAGQSKLEQW